MLAFREGAGAMQFRSKIFLVLALIGVVPVAVLGAATFIIVLPAAAAAAHLR